MPIDVMCTCSECAEAEAPLKVDLAKIMNLQVKMDFFTGNVCSFHFDISVTLHFQIKLDWC